MILDRQISKAVVAYLKYTNLEKQRKISLNRNDSSLRLKPVFPGPVFAGRGCWSRKEITQVVFLLVD